MVKNKSGLIVNISSYGGWQFMLNVAYTIGKSACDRMATDSAIDLKKENVAMVSLWPGGVKTEAMAEKFAGCEYYWKAM
jgi:dehydrogenase/reductase SDR family protein 1